MTALGLADGMDADYAEFGDALQTLSCKPKEDLIELFCRVLLSIAIHNTDDHLRNHDLLMTADGWRLSPVFDINPSPHANERRALGVFGAYGADETEGLAELGDTLGLSAAHRQECARRVIMALAFWEDTARRLGCAAREIAMFRPVIEERVAALRSSV